MRFSHVNPWVFCIEKCKFSVMKVMIDGYYIFHTLYRERDIILIIFIHFHMLWNDFYGHVQTYDISIFIDYSMRTPLLIVYFCATSLFSFFVELLIFSRWASFFTYATFHVVWFWFDMYIYITDNCWIIFYYTLKFKNVLDQSVQQSVCLYFQKYLLFQ